jgi:ADP-heptose:LPS heptosyltransferase/predicted SAM-dependent methyltransferase
MTWSIDGPQGNESGKIKWDIVPYTRGRGLDLGCGYQKTFPHFIGVDNRKDALLFGAPINPDVQVQSAADLPMFASGSMDFVFSSHLLEHIPLERHDPRQFTEPMQRAIAEKLLTEKFTAVEALREWMRIIKREGYLVLYVPDEDEYPKVGEAGANPDHCWNVNYDTVIRLMKETGHAWDLIDYQKRNKGTEYSLFFVFRKVGRGHHFSYEHKRKLVKTAGVVRYGAWGDLLQTSSVLRGLKRQGYHVTLYTSPPAHEILLNDPHIDEFYLQDRDQVPNHLLGEFWAHESEKYTHWVNLSESVEGNLLAMPGKTQHVWSPEARHRLMNHNYIEMAHLIAGVPHEPQIRFYPSEDEKDWSRKERARLGGDPLILWALSGSSVHKTWGGLDRTIAAILLEFPNARVLLVGGLDCIILEAGWQNEPRVICRSGIYSMRQTLALLEHVDVMIGPETGVMNAGANLPLPKIVFLSHSTHENLTRDWENVYALTSVNTHCPGRGENAAPACHQMHYGWTFCKQFREEGNPNDGTAQCMADIDGEAAWAVIRQAIASTQPEKLIQVA